MGFGSDIVPPGALTSSGNKPYDNTLFYSIEPGKWYGTYPYYFEVHNTTSGGCHSRFFLPIPPSSLTTQQLSTSEAHATIGGVVEETSAPVFYTITMVGTTGMSGGSRELTGGGFDIDMQLEFRKTFEELTGTKGILGKFRANVLGAIDDILPFDQEQSLPFGTFGSAVATSKSKDTAKSLLTTAQAGKASGFLAKVWKQLTGESDKTVATPYVNGYSWSHALRQFFLVYAREKAINPDQALFFVDMKSGCQYRCVPRSVQFQQTAQSPYTQQYNIVLKCWALTSYDDDGVKPIDRFGPNGDLKDVATASVTGAISKLRNTKKQLRRIDSVAGSIVRNTLGGQL